MQKKKQKIEYERKQIELRRLEVLKQEKVQKLQKSKSEQQFYQPPLPTEQKEFSFHSQLEDFKQHTSIDDRHIEINLRPGTELTSAAFRLAQSEGSVMVRPSKPTIQALIKSLPSEKLLFLSYEVFHVPVSKRPSPFPWNG